MHRGRNRNIADSNSRLPVCRHCLSSTVYRTGASANYITTLSTELDSKPEGLDLTICLTNPVTNCCPVWLCFAAPQCRQSALVCWSQDGILPAGFNENLDRVLTKLPFTLSGSTSTGDCQKYLDQAMIACSTGLSSQQASYSSTSGRKYAVTMCTCIGGPYNVQGLAALISGIPEFLLHVVKGLVDVLGHVHYASLDFAKSSKQLSKHVCH